MTSAVLYALSVDPAVQPLPPGSAPFEVLSRQVPRLVVHLLNGDQDRGIRFFPLIGRGEDDTRRFFVLDELLAVSTLQRLHGLDLTPLFVVDGLLRQDSLRLRIHGAVDGRALFDEDVPFDPQRPLVAVSRLMFELTGLLRWPGTLPAPPQLADAALGHYLIARDNLLGLEAGVLDAATSGARAVSSGLHALEPAPDEPEVQQVMLELASQALQRGAPPAVVAAAVHRAADVVSIEAAGSPCVVEFLCGAAPVLESCGEIAPALEAYERAAMLEPSSVVAICRAATIHFEAGRLIAAQRLLQRAVDAGGPDAMVLAQLALIEQQLGNVDAYERRVEELLRESSSAPPRASVVRIAVSYLLDRDRAEEALALAEDCLDREPDTPAPWFDKGRALLGLGQSEAARAAFERCLQLEPGEAIALEIERQLRFARRPQLLREMRDLDQDLQRPDLRPALRRARRLTRENPELPEAWLFLGVTLQRLQHPRRAERALRRSLELEPELGEAHNRLGIMLVARGKHIEGHEHLQHAVRLLPQDASAHIHFAQACRCLGQIDEGLSALRRAATLGGPPDTLAAVRRSFGLAADDE